MTTKHAPATQFGVGYGFIVTTLADGSIPLNSKALAKIEPNGHDAIVEMQRRANAYPQLVAALREIRADVDECDGKGGDGYVSILARADALLRSLGEAE